MFLNLQRNKYEIFVLVGVLSGFGTKLLLQPNIFCGCTLMRGTFKNNCSSDTLQSAQALGHMQVEKLEKTMELKPTEHTKMLWGVWRSIMRDPRLKDKNVKVVEMYLSTQTMQLTSFKLWVKMWWLDWSQWILSSVAMHVVEDKNNMVVWKVVMMASKLLTIQGTPRLQHLWVNLTWESAEKHPGQVKQNL